MYLIKYENLPQPGKQGRPQKSLDDIWYDRIAHWVTTQDKQTCCAHCHAKMTRCEKCVHCTNKCANRCTAIAICATAQQNVFMK